MDSASVDEKSLTSSAPSIRVKAPVENALRKDEILRTLFGDVGDLIDDYSCAVESSVLLHGRMYITTRFLCFYSNIFGLEKKIRIPFTHIKDINRENTALVIPNAISVSTYRRDSSKEYIFRSFWDRDETYRILKDVLDRNQRKHRRSVNSIDNSSNSYFVSKPAEIRSIPQDSRVHGSESPDNFPESIDIDMDAPKAQGKQLPKDSDEADGEGKEICESEDDEFQESEEVILRDGVIDETPKGRLQDEDFNTNSVDSRSRLFRQEVAHNKLNTIVITDSLPVSVLEYFALFIDDEAPYSYLSYYTKMRNYNVSFSPWTDTNTGLGPGSCRESRFIKPLNLPTIQSTRCTNIQRYRRFGDYGIVLCSSTRMEDVPGATTFTVEDVLSIRTITAPGDGSPKKSHSRHMSDPRIAIEITFEVKFFQSTMFRYFIENSTSVEMQKWFKEYFLFIKSVCEKHRTEPHPAVLAKLDKYSRDLDNKPSDGNNVSAKKLGSDTPGSLISVNLLPPNGKQRPNQEKGKETFPSKRFLTAVSIAHNKLKIYLKALGWTRVLIFIIVIFLIWGYFSQPKRIAAHVLSAQDMKNYQFHLEKMMKPSKSTPTIEQIDELKQALQFLLIQYQAIKSEFSLVKSKCCNCTVLKS